MLAASAGAAALTVRGSAVTASGEVPRTGGGPEESASGSPPPIDRLSIVTVSPSPMKSKRSSTSAWDRALRSQMVQAR